MAYPPQGYLYQPSASLALYSCPAYGAASVLSGPRTELELGRSSSGSAFAPYAGSTAFSSASPPGYNSHLPAYSAADAAAAAATFSSYVSSPYDQGMAGSIGYHPYANPLGSYPYGDPAYRKNATRDATATLKAWLGEHRKNPYPTKGEKIMLAIITKMTLTQVSTWFANARRRLKKENKMTWTPRNRSEDEEEDENIDLEKNDDDEPVSKPTDKGESTDTESDHKLLNPGEMCDRFKEDGHHGSKDTDPLLSDSELKEQDDQRTDLLPESANKATITAAGGRGGGGDDKPSDPNHNHLPVVTSSSNNNNNVTVSVIHSPPSSAAPPKPKLWSLAEIATSSDRCKGGSSDPQAQIAAGDAVLLGPIIGPNNAASPAARSSPHHHHHHPHQNSTVLSRPLYYTSPFYPGSYTNYGGFGHLHSNHHHHHHGTTGPPPGPTSSSTTAHFNGLNQTVLSRAESLLVRESQKVRGGQTQVDLCKDSPFELKKGMSNI